MSFCDDLGNWDQIGCSSDGFDAMSDFGNELLESWGFDGVSWSDDPVEGALGEEWFGAYDASTQTIHLSPDFLCQAEPFDVVQVVAHEAVHAAVDQAGWDTGEEEPEGYGFGISIAGEVDEECISSESGSEGELPDYPWVSTGSGEDEI